MSLVTRGRGSALALSVLLAACGGAVSGVTGSRDAASDAVEDSTVADAASDVTTRDTAPTDSTAPDAAEQEAPTADGAAGDAQDAGSEDADAADAADGQESSAPEASTCPPGEVLCDAGCIDPATDPLHCGASPGCGSPGSSPGFDCARACGICSGGQCMLECGADLVVCHGECVDPMTNDLNCGAGCSCTGDAAGVECRPGQVCDQGECIVLCAPWQIVCDGGCVPEDSGADGGCP